MKTSKLLVSSLSALLLLVLAGNACAGPRGQVVNERQENQAERIKQGVQSGELTKLEAMKLRKEARQIRRAEKVARSDGKITANEAKRLNHLQNKQSKAIYKQKHDAQDRH